MHVFFNIFGRQIAGYGLCIVTGGLIANLIAYLIFRRKKWDFNDLILVEAYGLLGAFVGAKLLFLLVSVKYFDFSRITDLDYLARWMQGGFVFYGGLIGGIGMSYLASRWYKISYLPILREVVFLIPFGHAFGRLGCFCAGCCFGVPYHGPFAVVFPEGSFALPGVELFPVQLVEAISLLIISLVIYIFHRIGKMESTIEFYMVTYGILRLILEQYRYDAARGFFLGVSTSQWISIFLIIAGIGMWIYNKKNGGYNSGREQI